MEIQKILEALNPHERKILPYLKDRKLIDICKKSNLDKTSVLRALEFLQNKGIVKLNISKKKIVELGINGSLYLKKGLPERRLLDLLNDKRIISLEEGKKQSNLSEEEFKVSLGVLKRKALIELKNGNILFNGSKEEISKKTLEELFLENLPIEYDLMTPEQLFAFKNLQNRKSIIEINYETNVFVELTELGEKILSLNIKSQEMIEQLNPEILKKESNWKGKLFRRYDVSSPVPELYGGKRHFVNQSIDYARKIWTEMGFKEMSGDLIQSSFWNFDALFTPQDHPVREMHDTFFINKKSELPDKKISLKVKEAHERGVNGSKGWRYTWDAEESKRLVLRTHTTCLSSHTLYNLKKEEIPSKFFAIGKCFRNETVDWSHGFEFNQTEGIVVDENANFKHLFGYLKQFFKKMGFENVRFRPSYFPYTEPSVEIDVWNSEKKVWFELGGAGIFRPEVTIPLLGRYIPVLAWGPGFDRILMDYYQIKDLRELYKNNISQLRKMKFWIKK